MFGRRKPQPALPQPPEVIAQEPAPFRLHDLSIGELRTLQTEIAALLTEKEAQARIDFKREFVDRMGELGLTLDDLRPERQKKERKKRDLTVRFRDPENPENTWIGVGKPKRWLQDKLDQGHALEEFAVEAQDSQSAS